MKELTILKVRILNDNFILVDFNFVLSMINGKVLTYIIGNSSMKNLTHIARILTDCILNCIVSIKFQQQCIKFSLTPEDKGNINNLENI